MRIPNRLIRDIGTIRDNLFHLKEIVLTLTTGNKKIPIDLNLLVHLKIVPTLNKD